MQVGKGEQAAHGLNVVWEHPGRRATTWSSSNDRPLRASAVFAIKQAPPTSGHGLPPGLRLLQNLPLAVGAEQQGLGPGTLAVDRADRNSLDSSPGANLQARDCCNLAS